MVTKPSRADNILITGNRRTKSASKRGYKYLNLVTSTQYTMRMLLAFPKYVTGSGIGLFIYASGYHATLCEHTLGYFKLVLHRYDLVVLMLQYIYKYLYSISISPTFYNISKLGDHRFGSSAGQGSSCSGSAV